MFRKWNQFVGHLFESQHAFPYKPQINVELHLLFSELKRACIKQFFMNSSLVFLSVSLACIAFPQIMALVESEVAFQKRCEELEPGLFAKFRGQDIVSFSTLAFTLGSPQNLVNDAEWSELAFKIHGGDTTVGNTANIRRLHFEAYRR